MEKKHINKNLTMIIYKGRCNFIYKNEDKPLYDYWFVNWTSFSNLLFGFMPIKREDGKWNYICAVDGTLLLNNWCDLCYDFSNKYYSIIYNKGQGYNWINDDGYIISNIWFDECTPLNNGIGAYKKNNKWFVYSMYYDKPFSKSYKDIASFLPNHYIDDDFLYNGSINMINWDGTYVSINAKGKVTKLPQYKPINVKESKIRKIIHETLARYI